MRDDTQFIHLNLSDVDSTFQRGLKEQAFKNNELAALVYVKSPSDAHSDDGASVKPVEYRCALKGDYAAFLVWRHGNAIPEIKTYYNVDAKSMRIPGRQATREYVVLLPNACYAAIKKRHKGRACKNAIKKIAMGSSLDVIAAEISPLLGSNPMHFGLVGLSRALPETEIALLLSGGEKSKQTIEAWLVDKKCQISAVQHGSFAMERYRGEDSLGSPRSDISEGGRTPVSSSDRSTQNSDDASFGTPVRARSPVQVAMRTVGSQTDLGNLSDLSADIGLAGQVLRPVARPPQVQAIAVGLSDSRCAQRTKAYEEVVPPEDKVEGCVSVKEKKTPLSAAVARQAATKKSSRALRRAGMFAVATTAVAAMFAVGHLSNGSSAPRLK